MEQVLFKEVSFSGIGCDEELTLKGSDAPMSVEEIIVYLRKLADQMESGLGDGGE